MWCFSGTEEAHKQGAKIRVGLELEIPGYGCQDHFHEMDTEYHSWEVLDSLLAETKKVSIAFKKFSVVTLLNELFCLAFSFRVWRNGECLLSFGLALWSLGIGMYVGFFKRVS